MLANFLAKFQASGHIVLPTQMPILKDDVETLEAGDAAVFAAGILYALSGQTIDRQTYLIDCSTQSVDVDNSLISAHSDYAAEDYDSANDTVMNSWEAWGDSMENCSETNRYFDMIKANVDDFLAQDNW